MITDKQRKNQILRRLQKLPPDKIKELNEFMDRLEQETPKKRKILSYAGVWSDMDESTLDDLTNKLISRRQKNKRRFEG